MRKFLKKIAFFISIPILIVLILEMLILVLHKSIFSEESLNKRFTNQITNYEWINTINSDSLIVLSGSSSVRYGLSCSFLDSIDSNKNKYVNIAMDARDPIVTYFILKNINLDRVKEVYFGIDPWIYAKRYYKHRSKYMYLDFNFLELYYYMQEHDESVLINRYKVLLRYFLKNESQTNYSTEIPNDYGSVALKRKPKNFDANFDMFQLGKYGWSKLQFQYLQKIYSLCLENNIEFYTFLPPKRSDYVDYMLDNDMVIYSSFVNEILKINENLPVFGKFNQINKEIENDCFAEAYHLNEKGQKEYSKIFYFMQKEEKEIFSQTFTWIK